MKRFLFYFMSRSLKKAPYVEAKLLSKVRSVLKKGGKKRAFIRTWSRSSTIVPLMIGMTLHVHNGRRHRPVFVTEAMVGHKLGEFSLCRQFRGHIKKNKKLRR